MATEFSEAKKVHFIGIGGIGISAIARMMMLEGKEVSGSDRDESEVTRELAKLGAKVAIGQKAENIAPGTDLVIYTIAIPDDDPELARARELGIRCVTYPQALGLITKEKFTIAVSGAHGKTTTTAMVAKVMMDNGLDPTVVVGSILKDAKSNFIAGKSEYFVIEACEYRRSFLNYSPKVLVITNIDDDHLDYYKDIDDIVSAFAEMASKVPEDGFIVCDRELPHIAKAVRDAKATIVDLGPFVDMNLKLMTPGEHNLANAAAALAVADIVGIPRKKAEQSLESFSGTWRRSEYKGLMKSGAVVFDDYGHHPTEVMATLAGFREMFPDKRITVVFQPHLYSRTKQHLAHFGEAFAHADQVVFAPIYPAREPFDPSISSDMLADEVRARGGKAVSLPSFDEIEKHVRSQLKSDKDLLITMGAGDVFAVAERLVMPR